LDCPEEIEKLRFSLCPSLKGGCIIFQGSMVALDKIYFFFQCNSLIVIFLLGMPFSKPLFTVSYMFLTAGVSGFALTFIYIMVSLYVLFLSFDSVASAGFLVA
jgi:hypothetical protein